MLTTLKEELWLCQKELDASKEISKKLMMERNLLEQKVQRLERAKNEEKSTMERVYEDECCKLKAHIAELDEKMESTMRSLIAAESTISLRNTKVDTLQNSLKELDEFREFKADVDRKNQQTAEILKRQAAQLVELENLYNQEQVLRKRYYNTIEDMKGKIRVFCCLRPVNDKELAEKDRSIVCSPDEFTIAHPWKDDKSKQHIYDRVFDANSTTQEEFFEDTKAYMVELYQDNLVDLLLPKNATRQKIVIKKDSKDNWPLIMFAMAGGVVISLGTLATQYGWAFVGLLVTEVMALSLKVVIGTTLNYFLDGRINKADILFPGVGCFLIAACLGSLVHSSNAADNQEKLPSCMVDHRNTTGNTPNEEITKHLLEKEKPKDCEEVKPDVPQATQAVEKIEAGTADFLVELEGKRSIKVLGSNMFLGLGIVTFAGICYSLFSPAFNLATNDQWHTLREGVPHQVVYTAFFYFSVSCFVIGIGLNIFFLYRPMVGVLKSSFRAYLNDCKGRDLALLAGMVCGLGNACRFMAGQAAGYAAADAVQALPLVTTLWGIVLFGEYRRSSRRTYTLLGSMLFMFVVAMVVLMALSAHRKPL